MKVSVKMIQSLTLVSMVGAFQVPAHHSSPMKHINTPEILADKSIHNNVFMNLPSRKPANQRNKDFQLSLVSELVADGGIGASVLSHPLGFGLWSLLPIVYTLSFNSTKIALTDLNRMENNDPTYHPVFDEWNLLKEINGINPIFNHIKYGAPSIGMYTAASFCAFPLIGAGGAVETIQSVLTIGASSLFFASMAFMTPVLLGILKKEVNSASIIACIVLIVTTLPCLQLATWQIEYALRVLNSNPTDMILPDLWLNFMHSTNLLGLLVKPMNSFFDLTIFPDAFSTAGHAMVNSMADADKYATPSDISVTPPLTMNGVTVMNQGLMIAAIYTVIAVFPTFAAITNFGFEDAQLSKCPISQKLLKGLHQDDFAELNLNDIGLYLVATFLWTLVGIEMFASYTS